MSALFVVVVDSESDQLLLLPLRHSHSHSDSSAGHSVHQLLKASSLRSARATVAPCGGGGATPSGAAAGRCRSRSPPGATTRCRCRWADDRVAVPGHGERPGVVPLRALRLHPLRGEAGPEPQPSPCPAPRLPPAALLVGGLLRRPFRPPGLRPLRRRRLPPRRHRDVLLLPAPAPPSTTPTATAASSPSSAAAPSPSAASPSPTSPSPAPTPPSPSPSASPASAAAPSPSRPARPPLPSLSSRFSYCLVAHSFRPDRLLLPSPLILGRDPTLIPSSTPRSSRTLSTPTSTPSPSSPSPWAPSGSEPARTRRRGPGRERRDGGRLGHHLHHAPRRDPLPPHRRVPPPNVPRRVRPLAPDRVPNRARPVLPLPPRPELDPVRARPGPPLQGQRQRGAARRNYFMGFESESESAEEGGGRVGCLMVMNGGDGSDDDYGGPAGTLGNFQQQGFEVVYDLEQGRVGFARRRCTALWDSLSRG
uniref:Uncharacterized protein n=1 Tax=Ananas comosus var. bracteatus TaxID=296719 RepID=A0A6V7QND8_ANACO|nr:unnamed protein product [Ananas comosus var. bracteatus]